MTTKQPDLYAILDVPPDATAAEISHAYRALLRRHHPDTRGPDDDVNGNGSETALQRVLAAYMVLRDPARRADYDRQTTSCAHAAPPRPQQARPQPLLSRPGTRNQPPIVAGPVRWPADLGLSGPGPARRGCGCDPSRQVNRRTRRPPAAA